MLTALNIIMNRYNVEAKFINYSFTIHSSFMLFIISANVQTFPKKENRTALIRIKPTQHFNVNTAK